MKKFIKTSMILFSLLVSGSCAMPTSVDSLTPPRPSEPRQNVVGSASPSGAYRGEKFSYAHHTEMAFGHDQAVEVPTSLSAFARMHNRHLNKSMFFDTSFIADAKKVRAHHRKKKPDQANVGKTINVKTSDGVELGCTYFDRGSDTLLIVGEGFTNPREYMTPFVDMFDCDVVLFDFRGQGIKEFDLFDVGTWNINLAQSTFGMDSSLASLGQKEDIDVVTVVNHFKTQKNYEKVCGLGICYGAFILLKTAALHPGLFDRLILDGCWLSLPLVIEKLKRDPKMICSPQTGGWSQTWPWTTSWAGDLLHWLTENIWCLQLNDISIEPYLKQVKDTSVLFIYGKDDLMIAREEWETIWNGLELENKAALITSNPHVRNHFKQKELYKLVSDLFINFEFDEFKEHMLDVEKTAHHHAEQVRSFVGAEA